jgi:hypothetical protein
MSNGNSGFTKIYNSNNQFSTLNAGDLNASNIDTTTINGEQFITVTGYTPSSFSLAAANAYVTLLTSPNQPAATLVTDSRILKIPAGAVVRQITVTNNGVTINGGTTFSIAGFATTAPLTPALTTSYLTALTQANANAGAYRVLIDSSAAVQVAAGIALPRTTADSFITVRTLGADNTTGQMKVSISYSIYPTV